MKDNSYIMKFLEEAYPNRLPLTKVSEYELGVLVGQQVLIEQLKIKLKISEDKEQEVR